MSDYLSWARQHWISIILILGILVALWFVRHQREELMLDNNAPPSDE